MEIRIHPFFVEFYNLWRVLCENARDLVAKGVTWDIFRPACVEDAEALIDHDKVDPFIRLSELAFRKYEKELMQ